MKSSACTVFLTVAVVLIMSAVVVLAKIGGYPAVILIVAPLVLLLHPEVIADAKDLAISMYGKRPIEVKEVVPPVPPVNLIPNPALEKTQPMPAINEATPPPAAVETKPEGVV
jgi:hypothetical protein